jgi:hypothetical protein
MACLVTRFSRRLCRFLRELQDTYSLVLVGPFLIIACGMCVNTFSILLVRSVASDRVYWGHGSGSMRLGTLGFPS